MLKPGDALYEKHQENLKARDPNTIGRIVMSSEQAAANRFIRENKFTGTKDDKVFQFRHKFGYHPFLNEARFQKQFGFTPSYIFS